MNVKGYDHIRTECVTFLKKQKKSLTVSWSDDDESEGDEGKESVKHAVALTGRVSSDDDSCDEELNC